MNLDRNFLEQKIEQIKSNTNQTNTNRGMYIEKMEFLGRAGFEPA